MSSTDIAIPSANAAIAQSPFNDEHADVVLRSCDAVDFHVFKVVLSLASPFFKQMFSLTQPSSEGPAASDNAHVLSPAGETLPVIPFAEDSATIEYLLRLCYPIPDPPRPLDAIVAARYFEAAIKYELEEAALLLKETLRSFLVSEPLKVYIASCRLRLEEEAALAASTFYQNCPPKPIDVPTDPFSEMYIAALASYIPEMRMISAGCYYRLVDYVCTGRGDGPFCEPPAAPIAESSPVERVVKPPIPAALFEQCPADIVIKCSDGEVVKTHKTVLLLSSGAVIVQKVAEDQLHEGLPVVNLDEDGPTIKAMLRFCYHPSLCPEWATCTSVGILHDVWHASQKYNMLQVAKTVQARTVDSCSGAPVMAYFLAISNGWVSDATALIPKIVRQRIYCRYVEPMEFCSADALQHLWRLQRKYEESIVDIASRYGFDRYSFSVSTTSRPQPRLHQPKKLIHPIIETQLINMANEHLSESKKKNSSAIIMQDLVKRSNTLQNEINASLEKIMPDTNAPLVATVAQKPFNDEMADAVLRSSSDAVFFHVHRIILSVASPFFEQML
ncbi:hypothetical protein EIP91_007564 [Steccherinum ochraceum]|uniref:BTB domain-containing protein n=1 Tax=Steccherinum ochraceum TaxID=92696 RepID=A0A4R0RUK6_9APHY|nr:hypothetical protein EIP91_007564 [Steccherinum ochraceum]